MAEEPLIKVKPHALKRMAPLFAPGETLLVALPCGRMDLDSKTLRDADRDYFLVTDRRVLSVPGAWFRTGKGALGFLRAMIFDADLTAHVLGATLTVHVQARGQAPERSVAFANLKKPDAELALKLLREPCTVRMCKACGKPLRDDFAMCPFCQASLKRVCGNCGRPMQDAWVSCPYCGT